MNGTPVLISALAAVVNILYLSDDDMIVSIVLGMSLMSDQPIGDSRGRLSLIAPQRLATFCFYKRKLRIFSTNFDESKNDE